MSTYQWFCIGCAIAFALGVLLLIYASSGTERLAETIFGALFMQAAMAAFIVGSIFHLIRNQADESTNAVCVAQVMRDGEWVCSEWKLPEVMR